MNNDIKQVSLADIFPVMEEQLKNGGTVVFKPKGISMLPLIRQGIDSVLIKSPKFPLKKYDIPLFRRKDGSFILHRILKVCNDGTYVVCGDNQTVLEYGVRDEQIIGVVEGIYRDKKFVSVSNFIYKIYSRSLSVKRLWRKSFIRRAVKGVLRRCRLIK